VARERAALPRGLLRVLEIQEDAMSDDDDRMVEVQEALDTTDQMHTDISRLKRLGIMSPQEGHDAHDQIDHIAETLTEKMPEQ